MALTQAQIQTAFQNSLGRQPSSSELSSYFSVSQSGALSDQAIFQTISNSQEADQIADPVIRFYQAAFGRVPDQAGLQNAENFVRAATPTAATYQNLAAQFTNTQEFTNRYGAGTTVDAAFVQSLYTNILGRQGSGAEIAGYTSGSNGYTTRAQVFYAISQSQEAININNTAVNNFELNAAQGTATYTGALPGAGGTNATGTPVALTTAVDNLTGTTGNDAYNAILGGNGATLNTFDTIQDQGGSNDSLNILVNDAVGIPAGTKFSGIETININESAFQLANGTLDASVFQGASTINQTATGDKFSAVTNVQAGEVVGFTSDGTSTLTGHTVTAATGVTSETVNITKVATGSVLTLGETTAGNVTTVNVNGSVGDAGAITIDTSGLTAESSIKLGLTSNGTVTLAGSADTLATLDASTSTGNLTINTAAQAFAKLSSITTGSGNDVLGVKLAGHDATVTTLTVNSNAGNDTINFATDHATTAIAGSVTGGAGADSFNFTKTTNGNLVISGTVTDAQLNASLITVNDFGNGSDVLNVSGLGTTQIQQAIVNQAVNGANPTTLTAAANAAASTTLHAGDVAVFQYGADTYVYANEHSAANNATPAAVANNDALVKLAGVSVASLTAATFIA